MRALPSHHACNPMESYTSVAVFLLCAISLTVPSGYSLGALLLLLAGLWQLVVQRLPSLTRKDIWIMVALFCYAAVSINEVVWDGAGVSGIDKPLRFIFAIPALLWVIANPPRLSYLWLGIAAGALTAGGWASWQKGIEGVWRAQGHTHVIQFGNLSMLLGVLCLAALGWAAVQRRRNLWIPFLLVSAAAGILGSLLSGSRGGWIGFPVVLLVLYRAYGTLITLKAKVFILMIFVIIGAAVYELPQTGVQARLSQAVDNVRQYTTGEDRATSVGLRFEMWRGAIHLISEKPLTGWGTDGYIMAMQELGEEGYINPEAAQFGHAHNEFIDALAKRGLPGLIVLLALYLIPMRFFARQFRADNLSIRAIATAGVLLPVTYIDFGLSQAFLTHNSGVMMYAFLLAILWGIHANQNRHKKIITLSY